MSKLLSVPSRQEILAACSQVPNAEFGKLDRADIVQSKLNVLLAALEDEATEKAAIKILHELADGNLLPRDHRRLRIERGRLLIVGFGIIGMHRVRIVALGDLRGRDSSLLPSLLLALAAF